MARAPVPRGAVPAASLPSNRPLSTMTFQPDPATDPRPLPPEEPLPTDCCGSGCPVCVLDTYTEDLHRYRADLVAWRERHPEAGDAADDAGA